MSLKKSKFYWEHDIFHGHHTKKHYISTLREKEADEDIKAVQQTLTTTGLSDGKFTKTTGVNENEFKAS